MHTPATEQNGGVGVAAKSVAEHASAIARLEVELAALELKKKVTVLGVGIGMAVGAAVFGLIGLFFVFLTIAAALDTFLDTWLALLITTVLLFVIAGVLGLIGYGRIKKGTPPVPEQAIREAKLTQEALRR
jgi:uncharacterized membrane protein YqjE